MAETRRRERPPLPEKRSFLVLGGVSGVSVCVCVCEGGRE